MTDTRPPPAGPSEATVRQMFQHALVLHEAGNLPHAKTLYETILRVRPDHADACYNRANALQALGRSAEALAGYDRAAALRPGHAETHNNRGNALSSLARLDEALASYDRALTLRAGLADAWNNRGNALWRLMRPDEALASYDRAIALRPDYAEALGNRGNALSELRRPGDAVASYARAVALRPDDALIAGLLLHNRLRICDWQGIDEAIAHHVDAVRAERFVTAPFPLLSMIDAPDVHRQAAESYARALYPGDDSLGPLIPTGAGKIRIGYYSADFHEHATTWLTAEMFESRDADRFEIFAFSFGPDRRDAMRGRLVAAFDDFIDARAMSDAEIAILSREIGIDIAVDLKGYTRDARPGIFAHRCAPVQLSYLGYPGSMGVDYIDYIVTDGVVLPEECRDDYSEKVITLPGSYLANDSRRAISDRTFCRAEVGLPDSGFVFCCFNGSHKILPETFDSWMRILGAVDGSVLWLFDDNDDAITNLHREAEARGIDSARLLFAPHMSFADHLARYRLAGLFLDTAPYNAHTTASDALWVGLPVLTRIGRSFVGRVAASLLTALDLPELITRADADYEAMAIALASDVSLLSDLRQRLARNRLTTPLFDGARFARAIEAAYVAVHQRHRAGLPPDHIDLRP